MVKWAREIPAPEWAEGRGVPKVIARFFILLPFDMLIPQADNWPSLEGEISPGCRIRIYPPFLTTERPRATDSMAGPATIFQRAAPASFGENVLVGGRKVAEVNVLIIDIIKPEIDRSTPSPGQEKDLLAELAFQQANAFLGQIRVYSRAARIKPLVLGRDPWHLKYLRDDSHEFEEEEGKVRGKISYPAEFEPVALTPEIMYMIADRSQTAEPYLWDELLLDAQALLPDVGTSIVLAVAALETFISWALNILHDERPLPGGLWKWINDRDHWSKEPSLSDQFNALLEAFTGHSLKSDEPKLLEQFTRLRKARNSLVHEGVAKVGDELVDLNGAKKMIDAATKIISWVELLLPEERRRARSEVKDRVARKLATAQEADSLGFGGERTGKVQRLPKGFAIHFEPKPESAQALMDGGEPPKGETNDV